MYAEIFYLFFEQCIQKSRCTRTYTHTHVHIYCISDSRNPTPSKIDTGSGTKNDNPWIDEIRTNPIKRFYVYNLYYYYHIVLVTDFIILLAKTVCQQWNSD